MSRREELLKKYNAKIEVLDARVKELNVAYDKLCSEGKKDTPEGEMLYNEIVETMGLVNFYLRHMGRSEDGYGV